MLNKIFNRVVGLHALADSNKLGPIRVVDGDDIEQAGVRYRLDGMDAPETTNLRSSFDKDLEYSRGMKAKRRLSELIDGATTIAVIDLNKIVFPNRRLARLMIDGRDVAEIAIQNGWAVSYRERKGTDWGNPRTPFDDGLPADEDGAP